jgi:hypothetical protein
MKLKLILGFTLFFWVQRTHAAQISPQLNPAQRESLRYHLEHVYNEVDLLLMNQKTDERDLLKLQRDLDTLKVFQRIPFDPEPEALQRELKASAFDHGIKLLQFTLYEPLNSAPLRSTQASALPMSLPLKNHPLMKKLYFTARISGTHSHILAWLQHLKTEQMRLIDWEHPELDQNITAISPHQWILKAYAFQFREVKPPLITPPSPRSLLPLWARKNPRVFAKQEPLLWSFITKTEAKLPLTTKLYQRRGEFKLNEARLNFFLSRTLNSPSSEHAALD